MTLVRSLKALPAIRRAMKKVISIDHVTISLIPDGRVAIKPGGIYDNSVIAPRAPQDFMLEPYTFSGYTQLSESEDLRKYYQLTGGWDAVVEVGDHWVDGSTNYRVISIMPKDDFEVRAVVMAFGQDPNYG